MLEPYLSAGIISASDAREKGKMPKMPSGFIQVLVSTYAVGVTQERSTTARPAQHI